ncbi:hypothetical protein DM860_009509 [Cuscuta australis]|uniref:Protein MIS12 homolog n=1 Tax=Cuscuta australis TaxID=267555 RepID=A0A328DIM4_9ASTE|nr:hypothetical protein DM860_009509 [Cuscuta australis]
MEGSLSEEVFDSYRLNPKLFINEVVDSVNIILNEAFDFFQQEGEKSLKIEGTDRSVDLKKGVDYIRKMVQLRVDNRLSVWEKYCLNQCFMVPEGFSLPKDEPPGDTCLDRDAELDAQLDSLRNKLAQVGKESADLKRELQALERQCSMSKQSAASLDKVVQFYNELGVHDKFAELVTSASEFRSSMEKRLTRMSTEIEHERAGKVCKLNNHGNGDHSGLHNAKLEDLQQFLDDFKNTK